jgi:outer membrane lipoprotein carrier protein
MKISIILLISFIFSVFTFAQQDPDAKKILDQFSKKTKSYSAYKVDFVIETENHQNGDKSETHGNILIKGTKYRLNLNKIEIYFDGKDVYNYTPESNEVSISKPNKKKDDFFLNDPSKLFNLYTKDYKFRFIGESIDGGRGYYEIDLYPIDLDKKYSIIKLLIYKDTYELKSSKLLMKSGIHYLMKVISFNGKINSADKDFVFDIKGHKGCEVVDLR